MPADDSLSMDQISALFPQLENIQLVGAKGPQQIFTATLKSNFAPVMLRVVPTEAAGVFGWDPEFIVRSLTIVEQAHQGLLRVYEVGQAGPFTFIISEHSPYPRLADLETLPQISPQAALNLVRNMAEGLLTLHRKNIFHGGITPKLISLRADGGDALLLPINIYPAQPPVDMGDFASPEWVTGAEAAFTPGMDIYALGLTLYILLTRKTPMEAGFAMPSTLIKCSDAVDAVVSRAINPDTRERYRNLGDFITDLDKAIASPTGRNAAAIPPRPSRKTPLRPLRFPHLPRSRIRNPCLQLPNPPPNPAKSTGAFSPASRCARAPTATCWAPTVRKRPWTAIPAPSFPTFPSAPPAWRKEKPPGSASTSARRPTAP